MKRVIVLYFEIEATALFFKVDAGRK